MELFFDPTLAVIVAVISLLSGIGSLMQGIREKKLEPTLFNFLHEVVSATTAALCMFFLGEWQGFPKPLICFSCIVAASNAGWFMEQAKQTLSNRINKG